MRKCILVSLILTGVAAAQWFPFRHDSVEAQRAALREKLTRLAQTRQSLTPSELASVPTADQLASKDLLSAAEAAKPHATVAGRQNPSSAVPITTDLAPPARKAGPPSTATDDPAGVSGKQDVSLGEIARRYRAQKRHKASSGQ